MVELSADVEQQLRDLSQSEWSVLEARLRPPDLPEQVRSYLAQHLAEDQVDTAMGIIDSSKFAGEQGQFDEQKMQQHMGFFDARIGGQRNWGQGHGQQPGDDARSALEKRHGVKNPAPLPINRPGDGARAALEKRHHVNRQHA